MKTIIKRKNILILLLIILIGQNTYAQQWHFFGSDTLCIPSQAVYSFSTIDGNLYVGGEFRYITSSCMQANEIGIWDGSNWSTLGNGFFSGMAPRGFVKYKGYIYANGMFEYTYTPGMTNVLNTKGIARWQIGVSTQWEALPSTGVGIGYSDCSAVVYNDSLIIPDNYPNQPTRVCAYDGDINDYVHFGALPSNVYAMELYNGEVYAGGSWFTLKKYIGGTSYAAWQDVGGNCNYYIQDMTVDTFNNFLYVGGGFTVVDDSIFTDNVAIWNGFYWEKVGYGLGYISNAQSLAVYHGDLYAGLSWDTIGGVHTESLARWDGQNWHMVGGGLNNSVMSLEEYKDKLYIGGFFDSVGGLPEKRLACWSQPLDTVSCRYIKPRAFTLADTFYLNSGQANVQFYNNNAYVDSWAWDFGDGGTSINKDPLYHYHDTGTYVVSVSVTHNNCPVKTATKTITILNGTGIAELNKESLAFKLYPNPTDNMFYAEITLPAKTEAELRITGLNGHTKAVIPLTQDKTTIETMGWSNGIYLCNLFVDRKFVLSEKMVLAK